MIDRLSELEQLALDLGVLVDFSVLRPGDPYDGLFMSWGDRAVILVNRHRPISDQIVALAEELGHFHRSYGDSLSMETVVQIKSEKAGRAWAYEKLLPCDKLRHAIYNMEQSLPDIAEAFSVPQHFLEDALAYYRRKSLLQPHTFRNSHAGDC